MTTHHTVFNCNFLSLAAEMVDGAVDHLIQDPPYLQHTQESQRAGAKKGKMSKARPLDFTHMTPELRRQYASEIGRLCRRWSITFTDDDGYQGWTDDLDAAGLEVVRQLVWVRGIVDVVDGTTKVMGRKGAPQFSMDRPGQGTELMVLAHAKKTRKRWNGRGAAADGTGGNKLGDNVYYSGIAKEGRIHPAEKPPDLLTQLIREFTDRGETILDGFCGSGTTLVTAKAAGRHSIGCDIDGRYAQAAARRVGVVLR